MGSVINYIKCSQCGGIMFEDYYYNTDEIYRSCQRCGKYFSAELRKDEDGKYICDNEGKYIYDIIDNKGYGAIRIFGKVGGVVHHMSSPISQETIDMFYQDLEDDAIDKSKCYLTKWNDEKQDVESIYGEIPELYDEND